MAVRPTICQTRRPADREKRPGAKISNIFAMRVDFSEKSACRDTHWQDAQTDLSFGTAVVLKFQVP
jgi:hypothetical protein